MAVSGEQVAQRTIDLETTGGEIAKRDLRNKKASKGEETGLTEQRSVQVVQAGESTFIKDIMNTEVQLVDDLQKVSLILH